MCFKVYLENPVKKSKTRLDIWLFICFLLRRWIEVRSVRTKTQLYLPCS